jgi:hypothetical protein
MDLFPLGYGLHLSGANQQKPSRLKNSAATGLIPLAATPSGWIKLTKPAGAVQSYPHQTKKPSDLASVIISSLICTGMGGHMKCEIKNKIKHNYLL